jgi:hypothetical protein
MKATKSNPMRFTRIALRNWRNFTQADAQLQRRVFIVGPNASGKSNLLDVFRFLHDIVSVGGGFTEAVRKRGGVSRLRSLAARRVSNIDVQVEIGNEDSPTTWGYELHFAQDNRQRPIIHRECVTNRGTVLFQRPDDQDLADHERLTQTYLEQVNVNKDFRAVADAPPGGRPFRAPDVRQDAAEQWPPDPGEYPLRESAPGRGDWPR